MRDLAYLLFRWHGRVSRKTFWICGIIPAALYVIGAHVMPPDLPAFVVMLASAYTGMMLNVKRSHDLGYTGFFALILLVPLIQLWPMFILGFVGGTDGANRYGDPDPRFPTLFTSRA